MLSGQIADALLVDNLDAMVAGLEKLQRSFSTQELVLSALEAFPLTNQYATSPDWPPTVGISGSGGAALRTFNLSTAASLVAAVAAKTKIVKTGSLAGKSKSTGSIGLLKAVGMYTDLSPSQAYECLTTCGFSPLPSYMAFPWMRYLSLLRSFPFLEEALKQYSPLEIPFFAKVNGVSHCNWSYHHLRYSSLPTPRVMLIFGTALPGSVHGIDDVSTLGPTVCHLRVHGEWQCYQWEPEDVGLSRALAEEIIVPPHFDPPETLWRILRGEAPRAWLELTAFSAAVILFSCGEISDVREGVRFCQRILAHGYGAEKLKQVINITSRWRNACQSRWQSLG